MEMPHIGANCALDTCRSLDFLPVTCPFCKVTFCAEHRLHHPCPNRPDKALARCNQCNQMIVGAKDGGLSLDELLKKHIQSGCEDHVWQSQMDQAARMACGRTGCRELDEKNGIIQHCTGCERAFCLKHRHGVDHDCPALQADETTKRKKEVEALLSKIKENQPQKVQKKPSLAAKKKMNPTVELMKMKSKAKGQASLPLTSRIYLYVTYPQEHSQPADLPMFFDKTIRVGKLLDMVAQQCGVKNDNNRLQPGDAQTTVQPWRVCFSTQTVFCWNEWEISDELCLFIYF
ncbi:hypothetical protein BX666DRAFT_1430198 [Dichotomocladium elegans]|nr:hypothetical protein BX666DRAFT_1430198 [Dichotomocladium elegans]